MSFADDLEIGTALECAPDPVDHQRMVVRKQNPLHHHRTLLLALDAPTHKRGLDAGLTIDAKISICAPPNEGYLIEGLGSRSRRREGVTWGVAPATVLE